MKYVYEKNVERMKKLNDEGKLNGQTYLRIVSFIKGYENDINNKYIDPDGADKLLYEEMSKKYPDYKYDGKPELIKDDIVFSLDCVNGWKAFLNIYSVDEMIKEYELMRSLKSAHLLWPCHDNSINIERYQEFRDRVDYTLYDIKNFYEALKEIKDINKTISKLKLTKMYKYLKLIKAYEHENTFNWLCSFETFNNLIDEMQLQRFVNSKYEIIDIEKMENFNELDKNEIINEYPSVEKKYLFNKKYWENLKQIINKPEDKLN